MILAEMFGRWALVALLLMIGAAVGVHVFELSLVPRCLVVTGSVLWVLAPLRELAE